MSQDRTLRLWDVETGVQERVIDAHEATVSAVAFDPSGNRVATAGDDARIKVWDLDGARPARQLIGHDSGVWDLAWSRQGDVLVSGGADGTVRVWAPEGGEARRVLRGHTEAVYAVALTPDCRQIVSGSQDNTVRVWDRETGRVMKTLREPSLSVWGVTVNPAGSHVLATGEDGKAWWWPIAEGPARVVYHTDARLYWSDIDPQGNRIGLPGSDGLVRLVDLRNDAVVRLWGHRSEVGTVRFGPKGRLAATSSDDGTVRVWEVATGRPHWRAPMFRDLPLALLTQAGWKAIEDDTPLPTGAWANAAHERARVARESEGLMCMATVDGAIELWDMTKDAVLRREEMAGAIQVAVSRTGCLARSRTGMARWIPRVGPSRLVGKSVTAVAATRQGLALAEGPAVRFLSDTGAEQRSFESDSGVTSIAFFGERVAVGYADGNVELLEPSTGQRNRTHFERTPSSHVTVLSEGPMGTALVGYANGELGLWSLADGARLETLRLHGAVVHLIARGELIAAASEFGDVARLDLRDFHRPYCALVREVWDRVGVEWDSGHARLVPPPDRHPCAR